MAWQANKIIYGGTYTIKIKVRSPIARPELKRNRVVEQDAIIELGNVEFLKAFEINISDSIPDLFQSDSIYDLMNLQ